MKKNFLTRAIVIMMALMMLFTTVAGASNTWNNASRWEGGTKLDFVPSYNQQSYDVSDWFYREVTQKYSMKMYEDPRAYVVRGNAFLVHARTGNESALSNGNQDFTSGYRKADIEFFVDLNSVSADVYPEIWSLWKLGILEGRLENGMRYLDWDKPILRSEAAAISDRCENAGLFSFTKTQYERSFIDLNEYHWAYQSIMDMANKGIFIGNEFGEFNPNDPITVEQAISVMHKGKMASYRISDVNFIEGVRQTFMVTTPYTSPWLKPNVIKVSLAVGQSKEIYLYKSNANGNLECLMNDTAIATFKTSNNNTYGATKVTITGERAGNTMLWAEIANKPGSKIRVDIEVIGNGNNGGQNNNLYPNDILVSDGTVWMYPGGEYEVKAYAKPTDCVYNVLYYSSSNTSVFTVTSNGKLYARGAGEAFLTITTATNNYNGNFIKKVIPVIVIEGNGGSGNPDNPGGGNNPGGDNGNTTAPVSFGIDIGSQNGRFTFDGSPIYVSVPESNRDSSTRIFTYVKVYITSSTVPSVTVDMTNGRGYHDAHWTSNGQYVDNQKKLTPQKVDDNIYLFEGRFLSAFAEPNSMTYINVSGTSVNNGQTTTSDRTLTFNCHWQ